MRKKLFCLLLSVLITVCNIITAPVYAEHDDYIKNFMPRNTYNKGQFTDVKNEWYANSVEEAYKSGLMVGDSDTTFNPVGNIDNAAVITIAARLHSIYNTGKDEFKASSPWYQTYFDYAIANGICDNNINPTDTATRSFFVGIIGNAIDNTVFTIKNEIKDGDLYDVNGWYSDSAYLFYRAGILSGNDKYGTFSPDKPITRGEVSAILVRIIKPSSRTNVVLKEKPVGGTYTIIEDDGSLEAYRQRALVANFKVLLNGEEKDEKWQNDVYSYEYTEENKSFDAAYLPVITDDYYNLYENYILKGINEYTENGIKYYIELDSDGIIRFDDGTFYDMEAANYVICRYKIIETTKTKTYTYSDYTTEAGNMINSIKKETQSIDATALNNYIQTQYGSNNLKTIVGYLTDWENNWYITMNKTDMYRPVPREQYSENQSEFVFMPENAELKQWCKDKFGKYIVALVDEGIGAPVFLAEISGYSPSNEYTTVRNWDFSSNNLTIAWKYPEITFTSPITVYSKDIWDVISQPQEFVRDTLFKDTNSNDNSNNNDTSSDRTEDDYEDVEVDLDGLVPLVPRGDGDSGYYYLDYENYTSMDGLKIKLGDEENSYKIYYGSSGFSQHSVTITLDNTKAVVWNNDNATSRNDYEDGYDTVKCVAPQMVYDILYVEPDLIIDNILKYYD